MTIQEAFEIISKADPSAALHHDHICADPVAHDSSHCYLDETNQYTDEDAAKDSPETLTQRLASTSDGPEASGVRANEAARLKTLDGCDILPAAHSLGRVVGRTVVNYGDLPVKCSAPGYVQGFMHSFTVSQDQSDDTYTRSARIVLGSIDDAERFARNLLELVAKARSLSVSERERENGASLPTSDEGSANT